MRVQRVGALGRSIERKWLPLVALAGSASVAMITLTVARPSVFGYVVAIAGAAGGVLALYEIHNTRQIAQASFIRDLNTGFANNTVILCMPGSTGACKTAWQGLIREQLDSSHRPCNFVGVLNVREQHD